VAWWELVARNSGATVPDFHGVPRHLAVMLDEKTSRDFKEQMFIELPQKTVQAKSFVIWKEAVSDR
jgi:hypothetical protein